MISANPTAGPRYAIIGAGPAGLAGARALQEKGIGFTGFERHTDVGGLWDIENPNSTVYDSAHLISSRSRTQFTHFPMPESTPDYPSHQSLREYFRAFARAYDLYPHYRFGAKVTELVPDEEGWQVTWMAQGALHSEHFTGVLIANGTLSEPNRPRFEGHFDGQMLHAAQYRSPRIFADKRVLVVGAGNSGCDIAVDAVHHARSVAMSVRRGYHFVPKYIAGRPADTVGGAIKLPRRIKQFLDSRLLKLFTGDPVRFGFPKPDHRLYESHPIVNSLVLHHVGHGDIGVYGDVARLAGHQVEFRDGASAEFDLILTATGYTLHYPFVDREHLNWQGAAPRLYLNTFHPVYDNFFVLGMIEAAGIGWQGRMEQAQLVAAFIQAHAAGSASASAFCTTKQEPFDDMRGGFDYLKLDRMAYYVHGDTFRTNVRKHLRAFG